MFRTTTQIVAFFILSLHTLVSMAAAPITVTFQNGNTTFNTGATGTANYLVHLDSAVPQPGLVNMTASHFPSWVMQQASGASACASNPICGASFNLPPGSSCCLMLNLDGSHLVAGSYSLSPFVATTPTTYSGHAAPLNVIVNANRSTVPGAPTHVTPSPGASQVSVTWFAPISTGGSDIINYTVTSSPGSFVCTARAPATSCVVAGLTNGTPYTFTATATNANGTGPASAPSSSVTPSAGGGTVPSAPVGVIASPGNGRVVVSWSAPINAGGSGIAHYIITTTGGSSSSSVTVDNVLMTTIDRLSDSTTYTFSVEAINATGTGPSSSSSPVRPAFLSVSVPNLALSVSGKPRVVSVTNNNNSLSLTVDPIISPVLPSGTTYEDNCGNTTLAPGGSCTIKIIPGGAATSNCALSSDHTTTPSVISLTASGGSGFPLTATIDVVVLDYGCIYQGGYVFAIDDTTVNTASIGGTVAAQLDAVGSPVVWSSNNSQDVVYNSIWGIDSLSTISTPSPSSTTSIPNVAALTLGQLNCNGGKDGACNMNNILIYYSAPHTSPSINSTYYAAGLCTASMNNYTDWYLPAVCEMGPGTNCVEGTPSMSNHLGFLGTGCTADNACLTGEYWSSTEDTAIAKTNVFQLLFGSDSVSQSKSYSNHVRCVRALTI